MFSGPVWYSYPESASGSQRTHVQTSTPTTNLK